MSHGTASAGRSDSTGPSTSGMTFARLAHDDRVAHAHVLAAHFVRLCSVARATVDPATTTGSSSATGVSTPVRPPAR